MSQDGRPFFQTAQAIEVGLGGAVISHIDYPLQAGDTIGVQYKNRKTRFIVVSTQERGTPEKTVASLKLVEGQQCPWPEELPAEATADARPTKYRRRDDRHKILFNLDLYDDRAAAHTRARATDISAFGCYVETMLPAPTGTMFKVEFWMDTEKVITPAIVRSTDPGVGMGVEFTALAPDLRSRFQQYLCGVDINASGILRGPEASASRA